MKLPEGELAAWDQALGGYRGFRLVAIGSIIALGLLLYGYTLSFPFVFDDYIYLVDNPLVKVGRSFFFQGDFTTFANYSRLHGLDPDLSTNFILRPVGYLTFFLNYLVHGMNPAGFRVVNILVHFANGIVLFFLISRLLHTSAKRGALTSFSVDFIALSTALLFLVHPLQIESVTYVVQRFTSLGTLFYLGTILTFLIANEQEGQPSGTNWRYFSLACLIIGMLVKELLFTAPFMLVLLDCLVMGTPLKLAGRRALPYFFCLPITPVLIFFTAQAQHHDSLTMASALNIANGGGFTSYQYALTQLSVVLTYLRLILFPHGLNLDWDYPLSTSLWDGQVLLALLGIGSLLGGVWFWYRRQGHAVRSALLCCSILWFFLALAVDSSIVPLSDLMAEHRSYLPSIGILCAVSCGVDLARTRLGSDSKFRFLVPAGMIACILTLATATNIRQGTWRSEIALWKDTASKSPGKFRPWVNLSTAYFEGGRPQEAIASVRRAIALRPTAAVAYRNLGRMELLQGNPRNAVAVLRRGVQLASHDYEQFYDLGMAYNKLGDTNQCMCELKRSLEINPSYRPAHMMLGVLHARLGEYYKALEEVTVAAQLQPLNAVERRLADQLAQLTRPRPR